MLDVGKLNFLDLPHKLPQIRWHSMTIAVILKLHRSDETQDTGKFLSGPFWLLMLQMALDHGRSSGLCHHIPLPFFPGSLSLRRDFVIGVCA